jgi:hypothetical protein
LAKKLLLTINNIEHVINHSLTTLCRRFGERGVKLTDVILKKSRQKLTSYNQHLISVYISLKTSNIVSIIETAEYRHNLNDGRNNLVTNFYIQYLDVSDYIKEIVMCVVFVQAEVLLYSPQFINQVLISSQSLTVVI